MTDAYSDELREYMFSATPGLVCIDTIEFRHPAFTDADGNPVAIRVANDPTGFSATLEDGAPMNAGETVAFERGRFDLVTPDSPDQGLPKATLQIANVTQELSPYLDLGVSTGAPVDVTLRSYLSDDFTKPAMVIDGLSVTGAKSNVLRVEVDLGLDDKINAPLHDLIYRTDVFRGLSR
ncbi:MAG TPA: DUF1833 family protein [Rhizomicrobium sp.]|jgi:hypothetical protein